MNTKKATTVEEQIKLLRDRGMAVEDEGKAKEILLDVGYYRLGFYWFPFETTYPKLNRRTHEFIQGASFKEAVDLYYLDTEIRTLLVPYLHRIEINLRTFLIYTVSNYYKNNPYWFADTTAIEQQYLQVLPNSYQNIKNNEAIAHHHKKYPNDKYAPAWKTLEYMTFGDVLQLAMNLKDQTLKQNLAEHFGLRNPNVLWNWMNTVRVLRNLCAHGHNLYDLRLQKSIIGGPLGSKMTQTMHHDMRGVLMVVFYLLGHISMNRTDELKKRLREILNRQEANAVSGVLRCMLEVL